MQQILPIQDRSSSSSSSPRSVGEQMSWRVSVSWERTDLGVAGPKSRWCWLSRAPLSPRSSSSSPPSPSPPWLPSGRGPRSNSAEVDGNSGSEGGKTRLLTSALLLWWWGLLSIASTAESTNISEKWYVQTSFWGKCNQLFECEQTLIANWWLRFLSNIGN